VAKAVVRVRLYTTVYDIKKPEGTVTIAVGFEQKCEKASSSNGHQNIVNQHN
jgi:hypothetical protein